MINKARETWGAETRKNDHRYYGYYADPDSVAMDYESVMTLEELLEYWRAKNEICKDATSMSVQLGDSTIIIQEQGIRFKGSEPYIYEKDKDEAGAIRIEEDKLKIKNSNGEVVDVLPDMPVYYRIYGYQYAGTKIIKQLVGIRTPSRMIMIFGESSVTMRKDIFTLWIQLVEQLPPVEPTGEGAA